MDYNENILIKRCQDGDIDAFEELITVHKQKVYNIAFKMLNNEEDAMDVSQETLIKVYKSIKNFNQRSSFSTWIYKVCVNTCLDFLRKNKKSDKVYYIEEFKDKNESNVNNQIMSSNYDTPEEALDKKIKIQVINDAINKLTPDFKTMIILRDVQGFSYDEISNITNTSLGTVKSRIKRARDNLKKLIENSI